MAVVDLNFIDIAADEMTKSEFLTKFAIVIIQFCDVYLQFYIVHRKRWICNTHGLINFKI